MGYNPLLALYNLFTWVLKITFYGWFQICVAEKTQSEYHFFDIYWDFLCDKARG